MNSVSTSLRPSRLHLLRQVSWIVVCGWVLMPGLVEASCGSYVSHGPVPLAELADRTSLAGLSGGLTHHAVRRHLGEDRQGVPHSPCSNGQCRKGRPADDLPLVPKVSPVEDVRAVWIVAGSVAFRQGAVGRISATDHAHLPARSPNRLERPPRS